MAGTFDFAPNSHVAEEIPPEQASVTSFNGWDFTSKPTVPYRRKFTLTISGMRWYQNADGTLDIVTDPYQNVGRLLKFWQDNLFWDTFTYPHEYLGNITCRFADLVKVPKALPNSNGLVPDFEITLIHYNPSF